LKKTELYSYSLKFPDDFCRFYWCNLSLLPFWKECTVLGIWNSCWIMHYTLHALGPSHKSLLCVYWGPCIGSSRICCCLLCLWISTSTKSKIQSSGSTMWRFNNALILSPVCYMSRVQGDPREDRQRLLRSDRHATCNTDNG
jgi:hypothetical protein